MRYNEFYEKFNEMVCIIFETYTDDDFLTEYQIAQETNKALLYLLNTCINHMDYVTHKNEIYKAEIYTLFYEIISCSEMSVVDMLKRIRDANKNLKLEIDALKQEIEIIKEENRLIKEEIFSMNEEICVDICGENNTIEITKPINMALAKQKLDISSLLNKKN